MGLRDPCPPQGYQSKSEYKARLEFELASIDVAIEFVSNYAPRNHSLSCFHKVFPTNRSRICSFWSVLLGDFFSCIANIHEVTNCFFGYWSISRNFTLTQTSCCFSYHWVMGFLVGSHLPKGLIWRYMTAREFVSFIQAHKTPSQQL